MTGYRILSADNLSEPLQNKPRWMICVVVTAGILIMTLSAISAGVFIGYTYCYVEHRTALRTGTVLSIPTQQEGNITQAIGLPLFSVPLPESEETAQKKTINGAIATHVFVQKILKIRHTMLHHEHSYIPGPYDKLPRVRKNYSHRPEKSCRQKFSGVVMFYILKNYSEKMAIHTMQVTDTHDTTNRKWCRRPYKTKIKLLISGLVILVLVLALIGYLIGRADSNAWKFSEPLDPIDPPPPSPSKLRVFQKAAVCTDSRLCSDIGRNILLINGSAVDAAIAAMFCNGIYNQQSMGIGGGFFMTLYIKEEEKTYCVISREKAPGAASRDMFNGNSQKASKGGLAVGVPGEIRGMWAVHKRWGKLPWENLVKPTLEICKSGYPMSKAVSDVVQKVTYIKNDPNLKKTFWNSAQNRFHKPGTLLKPSEAICNTLKIIAEKGGDELYNGTLAMQFLEDLNRVGSIITAADLENYQPKITDPISITLSNGDTLYTPPPPSSGAILVNILNILNSYNFTAESINGTNNKILTYHRIIEAFKFAYAARTKLGDMDYLDLDWILQNVTSPEYGSQIRQLINDKTTSNDTKYYGAEEYVKPDSGTAHMSVIADNGDAVSVTSSINYYFGAGFTTLNTGIVMNNVMDDFSSPGFINYFGVQPSPANFIEPNKQPLSTMSPSIIVDRHGNAKLVIGAAGGTKIISAIALVIMRKLWFGQTIKQAVDEARIHHQTLPMHVEYEFGITEGIVEGLRAKGHGMIRYRNQGSVVCALYRNKTGIYSNADFRKGGDVAGMD